MKGNPSAALIRLMLRAAVTAVAVVAPETAIIFNKVRQFFIPSAAQIL